MDFEESVRTSKVLQGQENVGLPSPYYRGDRVNRQLDFEMQPTALNHVPNRLEKANYGEFMRNHAPSNFTGFLESNWFPKVLQGQEICSYKSIAGKPDTNLGAWSSKPQVGYNLHQRPTPSFYPLASEGTRNMPIQHKGAHMVGQVPIMLSSFSNFQTGNRPSPILSGSKPDTIRLPHLGNDPRSLEKASAPVTSMMHLKNMNSESNLKEKVPPICKIFGFSLTEDPASLNLQGPSKRSCTKVSYNKALHMDNYYSLHS